MMGFVNIPSVLFIWLLSAYDIRCKSYKLNAPVDLSHMLDENTINWDKNVSFQLINRVSLQVTNDIFYAKNDFIGAEHGGTHLDAPYHFNRNGWKVGDIPLDYLISSGMLLIHFHSYLLSA